MAEVLKNAPVYKSIKGHKRKHNNDDTQLIRHVSPDLTEQQRGRKDEDENIEIRRAASRLAGHKKIRQSVGKYHKKKPFEKNLKEDNSKEKLNKIKLLRNRRIDLCNNDIAHLKSPQHNVLYTCKKQCKRLVLIDCKVVVKKLNLNELKSVKNKRYGIYDDKTEKIKLSTGNKKNSFDKIISKEMRLSNCKVIVKKLNVNNLKSVKNVNYHVSGNKKVALELLSQNEKLPFDIRSSKVMVKRKPNLDIHKCEASNSNSKQNDLPVELNEPSFSDTDLVARFIAQTERFQLSTESKKLCLDKIVSKGLPLLNCKVIVKKLNINNLKSLKKVNYHAIDNEKNEFYLPSQNEKLPFNQRTSKELVKGKPDLDVPKCEASNSNSNENDLPEEINEQCSQTDLVTRFIAPSISKARNKHTEYESESGINKLKTEIKSEQMVLGTSTATTENYSKPDLTPYVDSNDNNLNQIYTSKVKTEIKNEPGSGSQTACIDNCSSLSSKHFFLLSNPVPEELVSEIKKEPYVNKTVCGSPEYFDREEHANFAVKQEIAENEELDKEFYNSRTIDKPFRNNVYISSLGKKLKEIKSEPNEICLGTQKDPINCSNSSKIKGVIALRERLLMYTSEKGIKQEIPMVNELKENVNDLKCNPDQKNKDYKKLYNTKLDSAEVEESSNNHGEKKSKEFNDAVLSSCSQNGIVVDDNCSLSNSEYIIAKKCNVDLAPLTTKQIALKQLCDTKMDDVEVKEKSNNFGTITANTICCNIQAIRKYASAQAALAAHLDVKIFKTKKR